MSEIAATRADELLSRLPRAVRGRYLGRLVQKSYGAPRPVVLAGIAMMVCYVIVIWGILPAAGLVSAMGLGPWGWPQQSLAEYSFVAFFAAPALGTWILTSLVYGGIRRGLVNGELVDRGGALRLRSCP